MSDHQPALDWLAAQRGAMTGLLEELVNLDSGSYDKPGVDAVIARVARFLEDEGVSTARIANATYGDAMKGTVPGPGGANKPVVLMGHCDTVFPKGEPTRRPFRIEGGQAFGPGVADMKAGIVMNAFVLAAFRRFGGQPAPVVGLFTSDEEIGSPACRPIIEATAREARAVLNAEPGRPTGNVVTGRKGGVFMQLDVHGKAAHSGGAYAAGISAIGELAHKTIALHALTDLDAGVTVNVGLVSGGQSVNTVAPHAMAQIDLRYVEPAQRTQAMAAIQAIAERSFVAGTSAVLTIRGEFLPLVQDEGARTLFDAYAAAMKGLGETIEGEFSGGCADSGFTASVGCPTLCSTGPVGGRAHSPEEYLDLDSLVPRAQGTYLTVAGLG
jgi:glutamate carboxypeptidase